MPKKRALLSIGRGLLMLASVYVPTFILVSAIVMSGRVSPAPEVLIPLTIGVSLAIALILMATVGGAQFRTFGFRPAKAGTLWWSLALGLGIGAILSLLGRAIDVQVAYFAGLRTWQVIVFTWIAAPIQEEIIFRGLFQTTVQKAFPRPIRIGSVGLSGAVIVSAVAFACVHLGLLGVGASPGAAGLVVFGALIIGLVAGHLRSSSGSLLPCFVVHALFNVMGTIVG